LDLAGLLLVGIWWIDIGWNLLNFYRLELAGLMLVGIIWIAIGWN